MIEILQLATRILVGYFITGFFVYLILLSRMFSNKKAQGLMYVLKCIYKTNKSFSVVSIAAFIIASVIAGWIKWPTYLLKLLNKKPKEEKDHVESVKELVTKMADTYKESFERHTAGQNESDKTNENEKNSP